MRERERERERERKSQRIRKRTTATENSIEREPQGKKAESTLERKTD